MAGCDEPSSSILAVNAGLSSPKLALYPRKHATAAAAPADALADPILTGHAQGLGPGGTPHFQCRCGGEVLAVALDGDDKANPFDRALFTLRRVLDERFPQIALEAVAHRVVHGGARYRSIVVIDDNVLAELDRLVPPAPLHQSATPHGIRLFRAAFPRVPRVACFDTAFHATLPEVEFIYALLRELTAAASGATVFMGCRISSWSRGCARWRPSARAAAWCWRSWPAAQVGARR